jgi:V8-like Glu-specific endopeptidase
MAYNDLIQKLYVAYYGRPADVGGHAYWTAALAEGELDSVLDAFSQSPEFDDRFGGLNDTALVDGLYRQLFNRSPEAEGLDFYTAALASGRSSLAEISLQIANGAQDTDATVLGNKLTAAARFTETIWGPDTPSLDASADEAAAFLDTIDASPPPTSNEIPIILAEVSTETLTLEQALAKETLPERYEIASETVYRLGDPLQAQQATVLYGQAEAVLTGATNTDSLELDALFDWSLEDDYQDLLGLTGTAVLTDAERYGFTDNKGSDFGFLADTAYEMVIDATNTTDFLFRPEMDGEHGRLWPTQGNLSPLVVQIRSTFNDNGNVYQTQGSGVLVGPNDVLTAAHVTYESGTTNGWAERISVAPGFDQGSTPYGQFDAQTVYGYPVDTYGGRISLVQSTYDMALVRLKEPLGYQYGYMNIGASLQAGDVIASGYPGNAGGAQVNSEGFVSARQAGESIGGRSYYLYEADEVAPGSSGGPLWVFEDGVATVAGNVSTTNWAYDTSNDVGRIEQQIIGSNSLIDEALLASL